MNPAVDLIAAVLLVGFLVLAARAARGSGGGTSTAKSNRFAPENRVKRYFASSPKSSKSKSCPRGACSGPPRASCPIECVEEPFVVRFADGSELHTYPDGFEVTFDRRGKVWDVRLGGRSL